MASRRRGRTATSAAWPSTTRRRRRAARSTLDDICRLVGERLHLLPPFRWRLVEVPFGLDHPYWIEDPDFDLDFHIRETAVPPPGDDQQLAETVARIFARPLDRARPLWELYLIHGLEGGRVALLTKIHHSVVDGVSGNEILGVLLDPSPEGREMPPGPRAARGERKPGDLEMLGRGLRGPAAPAAAGAALAAHGVPNLTDFPGVGAFPGAPRLSARCTAGARPGARRRGVLEDDHRARRRGRRSTGAIGAAPALRVRVAAARHGQAAQERARHHGQRRGGGAVRDRRARLAARARRAARGPARGDGPGVGAHGGGEGHVRQPGLDDDRADPDQRGRPARAADAGARDLKSAKERHRALPADLLTDATSFIPPAVHARASRADDGDVGRTPRRRSTS